MHVIWWIYDNAVCSIIVVDKHSISMFYLSADSCTFPVCDWRALTSFACNTLKARTASKGVLVIALVPLAYEDEDLLAKLVQMRSITGLYEGLTGCILDLSSNNQTSNLQSTWFCPRSVPQITLTGSSSSCAIWKSLVKAFSKNLAHL